MSAALAPLWSISEDLQALLESVATCDEDLLPELQAKIDAYIGMEAAKVDQVAHVLAALDYEQKAASDEIARLQDRKKAAKAAQDRLEQYVCRVITARGGKALKGATNTLSVRASDAVALTDVSALPMKYVSVTAKMDALTWLRICPTDQTRITVSVDPDKAAIKKALKAGEEVPGADLSYRDNLQRK